MSATTWRGDSYKDSGGVTGVTTGCPSDVCTGYELVKDLDFEDSTNAGYDVTWTAGDGGSGWPPIGGILSGTGLAGDFEGNGYEIRNLYIKNINSFQGLFRTINSGAEVRNLGLLNVNVSGGTGGGTLAGGNFGSVSGCHASGLVTDSGGGRKGGLLGSNSGMVTDCYANVNIDATMGDTTFGGLIGQNQRNGSVTRCYATGNLDGSGDKFGGLIGVIETGNVTSCYATGSIGGSGANRGGLMGAINAGTISSSYSTGAVSGASDGGGLAGSGSADVTLSYWDTQTSGKTTSAGGSGATGKTTDEMKALTTGAFGTNDSDWDFGDNTQYPALKKGGSTTAARQPCPRVGCFFGGGVGIQADPYQIFTIAHLNAIRGDFLDDHFVLTNDLDFSSYTYSDDTDENAKGWLPIGHDTNKDMDRFQGTAFTGSFDGGGHVIRNLSISRGGEDYIGLFGQFSLPVGPSTNSLRNLGLEGVAVDGDEFVGGLVGAFYNGAALLFCYTTGQVTGTKHVGGLLGCADQTKITSSYSASSVTASGRSAGGFMGYNTGTITSCYSTGSVTRSGSSVGGFVGYNEGTITSCYSTGSVTGSGSSVGGFVGFNEWTITSSYSTGSVTGGSAPGGFAGANVGGTVSMNFWDKQTSGLDTSAGDSGATGKTTDEMKALTGDTSGWGELSWHFGDTSEYPTLRTYEEMPAWTQVQGRLICGQSSDHFQCPALNFGSTTIAAQSYTKDTAITALELPAAVAAGMGTLTYSLTPDLPAGLSFVPATRTLSGTPSAGSPVATYTYTVIDTVAPPQTATLTFTIIVIDPAAPVFSVTTIDNQTYTENSEIDDLVLPVATGGTGERTYTLTADLPAGLAFEPATRTLSGTPTEPQAATAYSYTVTDSATSPLTATLIVMIAVLADTTAPDFAGATIDDQTYTVNTVITDLVLPAATDTGIVTYSLSPALPSGLIPAGAVTDVATPTTISGMPDTTFATMPYTYTAKDNATTPNTQTLMFMITVDDLPLVSISGGDPVTEGTAAEFTLTRTGVTTAALTVTVSVTGGDNFLSGAVPTEVVFNGGVATATITATTADDEVDEADGTVTATITADASIYRGGGTSASVDIADDDLPLVSIAGGASVVEGEAAEFTVTRVGVTTAALSVKVTVGGDAGFLPSPVSVEVDGSVVTAIAGEAGSFTVMIAASATEVDFTAATEGDDVDEEDGMIEATVTAIDGSYRVDGTVTASVDVTDNDLPSITSFEIRGSSGSIVEDADPKTITVAVAEGTSLVGLDPTVVAVRSDAAVAPSGMVTFVDGAAQPYTVTAGGDTVTYQVTVNVVVGTPPGVPGGFSAVAGVGQVTLSWTEPTVLGSTGTLARYEYRQTQGVAVSPWTAVEPLTALTQVVGSLMAGVVYGFEVRAVGSTELAGEATAKEEATAVGVLMFTGTIEDQTYTKDTAITALELPVAMGGMGALTYTLTPVPMGLSFDAASRTLTGTPTTTTTAPTTHTYTVTDDTSDTALTTSLMFMITISAAPATLSFGSETIANQTYAVSTVIPALALPEAMGGTPPLTYSLAPVPGGLSFNPTTRMLSGTPSTEQTATEHTYTVTDDTSGTALTASLMFTITVNVEGTPTFVDTVADQTYTENTAITPLALPAATGGMGTLTYSLAPVPAGLSFDVDTRMLTGTPTTPTPTATQHTYTVTDSTPVTALTASLTFTITVSEAETTFGIGSKGAAVHVYPNPAGDVLHIEFPGADDYGIALLTLTGQPAPWGVACGGRLPDPGSLLSDQGCLCPES